MSGAPPVTAFPRTASSSYDLWQVGISERRYLLGSYWGCFQKQLIFILQEVPSRRKVGRETIWKRKKGGENERERTRNIVLLEQFPFLLPLTPCAPVPSMLPGHFLKSPGCCPVENAIEEGPSAHDKGSEKSPAVSYLEVRFLLLVVGGPIINDQKPSWFTSVQDVNRMSPFIEIFQLYTIKWNSEMSDDVHCKVCMYNKIHSIQKTHTKKGNFFFQPHNESHIINAQLYFLWRNISFTNTFCNFNYQNAHRTSEYKQNLGFLVVCFCFTPLDRQC